MLSLASISAESSTENSLSNRPSERIPEVDGLRGMAILAVLAYHYISLSDGGGQMATLLSRLRAALRLGWSGVDLFFVLSGFLIGSILIRSRDSRSYFSTFYARRSFRILPVYFVWVALYPLGALLLARTSAGVLPIHPETIRQLPYFVVFAQTFVAWPKPVFSLGFFWLAPTWSLAVEEQFYLVAAPLFRWFSDRKLKIAMIAVIFVAPIFRVFTFSHWPGLVYIFMPCRADALAFGVLLALVWGDANARDWLKSHRAPVYWVLALLALPLPIFIKWFSDPYGFFAVTVEYSWLAAFFAALILAVIVDRSTLFTRAMRWGPLIEMGRLSYCMYLIHYAVLVALHVAFLRKMQAIDSPAGIAVTVLAFICTYAIARTSMTYFEAPMLRIGHKFKY